VAPAARTGIRALPRTGGFDSTPLTLGFWMVLVGFGLVVAGRRPNRSATTPIHTERRSWITSRSIR
jgi:LPXTG-motif cell wall-anchored protein